METYIFDWKRTLYDPEYRTLLMGSMETLEAVSKRGGRMVLIGKGSQEMYNEVERLGIKSYFSSIEFNEGPKQDHQFAKYIDPEDPKRTIVVGDRLQSELTIGHSLGATTIWVRQGKFSNEGATDSSWRPDHIVGSLLEVPEWIHAQDSRE